MSFRSGFHFLHQQICLHSRFNARHLQLERVRKYTSNVNCVSDSVTLSYEMYLPDGNVIKQNPNDFNYNDPTLMGSNIADCIGLDSVIILHGLFGAGQNWRSISLNLSKTLGVKVFAIDQRNHGFSPHTKQHNYSLMATDIQNFIHNNPFIYNRDDIKFEKDSISKIIQLDRSKMLNIPKTHLIGHSMGAKTAMLFALYNPQLIDTLLVEDMPPTQRLLSETLAKYVDLMKEIRNKGCKNRHEAGLILKDYVKDLGIRNFLLSNYRDNGTGKYEFRINLDVLGESLKTLARFDIDENHKSIDPNLPTLLLAATESHYIKDTDMEIMKSLFPTARLERVKGGHWIHSEHPKWFVDRVIQWIKTHK